MKARTYSFIVIILLIAAGAYVVLSPVDPDPDILAEVERLSAVHQKRISQQDYYIIIDYDLPIFKKRLWVIKAGSGEVIRHCHVSHAWNSGFLYAVDLSNEMDTEKSCAGAFVTAENYEGQYGYAMRIDGLQPGVNDNARPRAIVFHEHWWPWSKGCFMTLPEVNRQLIDLTQGGTLLYVSAKTTS